ncbi:MAG: bacterial Ig-like domain-containing protein, partial [Bacteroidales bacterium]|nr:bacterial Ig-like domain-containing protein [Bacteroidales bacterium]
TYDGNTTTSVSYTTDKVATDDVTFGTTATFADKNVGNGKAVSFNYTKSGADAANYAFANATGSVTADITPKAITISNIVASSKEYDGSAVAEGTYSYVGILENDDVEISYTASFANKTVGTDKPVTFNFEKSGADAENYVFEIESSEPKADISAKTLTLSDFVASDKVYDGTTVATNGAFADNRVAGDELEFTFDYEFETENADENISVIFSNIAVSGADAENYELATLEGTAKATISPITDEVVVNVELADKSIDYDGEQHEYTAGEAWTITSSHPLYNAQQYIAELEMGAETVQGTDAGEYAFGWSSESFENDNANFTTVRFDVTDGALVINKIDGVQVTIAGVRDTAMYDGLAHTVEGFAFSASNALYKETDMVNNGFAATATQTEVGETKMGLMAANFANVSRNFSNVTFSVEDGGIVVEPKNDVVVTITENSGTVAYNGEEQTVSGYAFTSNSELYKETDFTFNGVAEVKGMVAGTYEMNISAEDFENANANFVDVTFNVVDGKLTIEKSEETPNMPELTIETHMLKLTYVELPEGWAWEDETLGLIEGENEVVANYVGADAGNYTTEKVTITITRLACLHDGEHVILGAKEPTCTVDGYTGDLSCSICGLVYEQGTVIPALGHTHGEPVEENRKEPTCTVAGSVDTVVYCTIDGEELSRETYVLPMLEHVAGVKVAENYVAPTFTAAGSVDSVVYCTIGGEELSRETFELPMLQKAVEKIEILSMPKTEYVVGEDIDITGAKISVTFNDGSVEEIDLTNEMLSGFDNTLVAEQDITVTYLTFTTTIHVTVNEKTAVSDIATDDTSIYAFGHTIVVETTLTGDIIVNDVNGRIVAKSQSNGDRTEIYVPKVGVYAVRIGTVSQKVVVR